MPEGQKIGTYLSQGESGFPGPKAWEGKWRGYERQGVWLPGWNESGCVDPISGNERSLSPEMVRKRVYVMSLV